MDTYLFDDVDSVWHAVLGFLVGAFAPFLLGAFIILVFLVYEVREPEDPVATVGDVVEFWSGFGLGILLRTAPLI